MLVAPNMFYLPSVGSNREARNYVNHLPIWSCVPSTREPYHVYGYPW